MLAVKGEKIKNVNKQQKRTPFRDCSDHQPWPPTSCGCVYQMDREGWKWSDTPPPGRGSGSHSLQFHPQSSTEDPLPRGRGAQGWPATSVRYTVVFRYHRWSTFGKWSTNKTTVLYRLVWVLRLSCSRPKGPPHYPKGKGPASPSVTW